MQGNGIARHIARWVALGALFLIPLTPLIVANPFFFPFITGKAFFFRIVVELAVAAWVVLAFLDKAYRLRFSWIGVAVVAFVAWMFIADAFALNAAKAFWSNFERMEGWVLLIHLLGLFFAASAVLRVEKKWRAWFLTSLTVSIIVCGYVLLQLSGAAPIHQGSIRVDASLGNSIYLGIYLLFNVFIALWLALTEKRPWLKWSLIVLAVVEAILIFFTETRGTVIGLTLALSLCALLTAFTAGKRARGWAAGALMLIVLLVGAFYLARDSTFVQQNHMLQRISSISLSDGQTRFTLWHMALQGVGERPIVGWGQEGFNYIFNKFYDPSLYAQEQWFDRAHNAFIDWLTAGGVPAFLLYLALFGTAIVLLWRSSELSRPERIALTGALVGYAVHNIFVFDNLYSYVYFFAILALIDSQTARPIAFFERMPQLSAADGVMYALPIASVTAIALIWFVNIPGIQVATGLITTLSSGSLGAGAMITAFEDLTAHPAFAAQEVREQLVTFASSAAQSTAVTDADKQRALTLAASEMQKQIAAYPLDAREHMELSYVYRAGGDGIDALKELQAALALSPKKEGMWIEQGALAWDMGDTKGAKASFDTAYALGPQFSDLAAYAAAGDIAVGDLPGARKILQNAFGTTTVDTNILAIAYYRTKDWADLAAIWQLRVAKPDAPVESWFSLAAVYYQMGDRTKAIQTVTHAVELFPDAASSAAVAIKQINGTTPSK